MSVREEIIQILKSEGYDNLAACQIALDTVNEFMSSGKERQIFHSRTQSFELVRKSGKGN